MAFSLIGQHIGVIKQPSIYDSIFIKYMVLTVNSNWYKCCLFIY